MKELVFAFIFLVLLAANNLLYLIPISSAITVPAIINITEAMSYSELNETIDLYYRKQVDGISFTELSLTGTERVPPSLSVNVYYENGVDNIKVFLDNGTNSFYRITNSNGDALFNGSVMGIDEGNYSLEIEEVPEIFELPESRAVVLFNGKTTSVSIKLNEKVEDKELATIKVYAYYFTTTGKTPKKDLLVSLVVGKEVLFGSTDNSGTVIFTLYPNETVGDFTLRINTSEEFYSVKPLDGSWEVGKTTNVNIELKLVEVPWFLPADLWYSIRSGKPLELLNWSLRNWMIIVVGAIFIMIIPILLKILKEERGMKKRRK